MGSGGSAVDAMVIGCLGVERRAERFLSYLAIFVVFQATTKKMEEWPKSAPFFFSATLLEVLNPSFFWGVQMEFSIQNEINSFHLFCNTIRLL